MCHVGMIQKFWTNFEKFAGENITRNYLIVRMELLENYWSQVVRTHHALQEYDGTAATEYMEKDIYAKTKNQYIITKSKLRNLLRDREPAEESANCKVCCHVEYDIDMPEITLPEFDSNQANWDYFRDMFKVLVHDNEATPRKCILSRMSQERSSPDY